MENIVAILTSQSSVDTIEVLINIAFTTVMAELTYIVFIFFGNTFSNRKQFGKIFFLVAVSTTLIISIIKASLALSLGLVGALSIVRFRAAIKEPEELAYTFFCITMGLGFGANERVLTSICGLLILIFLIIRGLINRKKAVSDTYNFIVITSQLSLKEVTKIISDNSMSCVLRRADKQTDMTNLQFIVEFASPSMLEKTNIALVEADPQVSTSFISNTSFM